MSLVRNNPRSQVYAAMVIIAVVALIDGAGVFFISRPVLWATTVPLLIPVLFGVFVIPASRVSKG
jgi:hypothetical protein